MPVTRKIQVFHQPTSFSRKEAEAVIKKLADSRYVSRDGRTGKFIESKTDKVKRK